SQRARNRKNRSARSFVHSADRSIARRTSPTPTADRVWRWSRKNNRRDNRRLPCPKRTDRLENQALRSAAWLGSRRATVDRGSQVPALIRRPSAPPTPAEWGHIEGQRESP